MESPLYVALKNLVEKYEQHSHLNLARADFKDVLKEAKKALKETM